MIDWFLSFFLWWGVTVYKLLKEWIIKKLLRNTRWSAILPVIKLTFNCRCEHKTCFTFISLTITDAAICFEGNQINLDTLRKAASLKWKTKERVSYCSRHHYAIVSSTEIVSTLYVYTFKLESQYSYLRTNPLIKPPNEICNKTKISANVIIFSC